MIVADYLKRFLTEQPAQEAAVPGLGVFYAGEKNGKTCILFKEVLPTGKAFLNFIAFEENLTEQQVREEIEKWVRGVLQQLKANGRVSIDGVGSFSVTGDKVVFEPVLEIAEANNDKFGLEGAPAGRVEKAPKPAPVAPPAETSVAQPVVQPRPQRPQKPSRVQEPIIIHTPEKGRKPQRPVEKPKPRPVSNPGGSGTGMVLGGGKSSAKPSFTDKAKTPFYSSWWFIMICVLAVLAVLVFAVTPVREKILGPAKEKAPEKMVLMEEMDDTTLEQAIDQMIAEDVLDQAMNLDKEAENKAVAQAVIAGEKNKKEAEKQAKDAAKKPEAKAPKAEPKPEVKPETKAVKPAPTPKAEAKAAPAKAEKNAKAEAKPETAPATADVTVGKPAVGKFYIIVGSFGVKENAVRHAADLQKKGFQPTVLYVEERNIYQVSVKTCQTREEAIAVKDELINRRQIQCWISTIQ